MNFLVVRRLFPNQPGPTRNLEWIKQRVDFEELQFEIRKNPTVSIALVLVKSGRKQLSILTFEKRLMGCKLTWFNIPKNVFETMVVLLRGVCNSLRLHNNLGTNIYMAKARNCEGKLGTNQATSVQFSLLPFTVLLILLSLLNSSWHVSTVIWFSRCHFSDGSSIITKR